MPPWSVLLPATPKQKVSDLCRSRNREGELHPRNNAVARNRARVFALSPKKGPHKGSLGRSDLWEQETMSKPRLLDLFSGAGGCAVGYARAGFDVVGVDIAPQKNYPYEFHCADALTFPLDGFDVIHASPPCQAYTCAKTLPGYKEHPELVPAIRLRLILSG